MNYWPWPYLLNFLGFRVLSLKEEFQNKSSTIKWLNKVFLPYAILFLPRKIIPEIWKLYIVENFAYGNSNAIYDLIIFTII